MSTKNHLECHFVYVYKCDRCLWVYRDVFARIFISPRAAVPFSFRTLIIFYPSFFLVCLLLQLTRFVMNSTNYESVNKSDFGKMHLSKNFWLNFDEELHVEILFLILGVVACGPCGLLPFLFIYF